MSKRRWFSIALLLIGAVVAAVVVVRALLPVYRAAERGRAMRAEIAERAARVSPQWRIDVDAVLADRALWDVLQPKERNADAAAFFAARLPPMGAQRPAHLLPPLPEQMQQALASENYLASADEMDFDFVDTSWMSALRTFTHWDVEAAALAHGVDPAAPVLMIDKPQTMPLLSWGRVRLAEGIVHDEVDDASLDVRALARLLWSTDALIDGMLAAMLLEEDAQARAVARELGAKLSTADIASASKLVKVVRSSTMLFHVATPAALEPFEQRDVAFCGALTEGASSFLLGRSLFAAQHPQREAAIALALERSPCALTRVRRQWHDGGGSIPLDDLEQQHGLAGRLMKSWLTDALLMTTMISAGGWFGDEVRRRVGPGETP